VFTMGRTCGRGALSRELKSEKVMDGKNGESTEEIGLLHSLCVIVG